MSSISHIGLFPWCVDEETSYFKDNDLKDKAVPIWWKVKKWNLQANGVFLIFGDSENPFSGSDTFEVTDLTLNEISTDKFETEKDLVRAGVIYDPEAKRQYRLSRDHLFLTNLNESVIDSFVKIGPNFEAFFDQDGALPFSTIEAEYECGSIDVTTNSLSFSVPIFSSQFGASMNATLSAIEYWEYS